MSGGVKHLSMPDLEAGLEAIRRAPEDEGVLELIVRRPRIEEREVLEQAELDPDLGLVGDNWRTRGSSRTADGSAHPLMQITVMGSRAVDLVAQRRDRWQLAGDQLFVDLDLSVDNLPPGTRLAVGSAVIEVTGEPHTGCKKFVRRFGPEALRFVSSPEGKRLRLRGLNARVIRAGAIRVGDAVAKSPAA